MTATALELCTKLGYYDVGSHESGSLAKVLLDDLKAFVENEPAKNDPDTMTTLYLLSPGKIFRTPYAWTPDGVRVTEVLSQLFSLIIQSRATQDQTIDLEEADMTDVGNATVLAPANDAGVPSMQNLEQTASLNEVHLGAVIREADSVPLAKDDAPIATVESQGAVPSLGLEQTMQEVMTRGTSSDAGPVTKLALREPTLVADLLRAGFNEPFPVTASSKAELLHILDEWMAQHPAEDPPGSRRVAPNQLGRTSRYYRAISLATTSNEVHVNARQISPSLMAYVLNDDDGSCMMVRPGNSNNMYRREYHGWLGGDRGFTLKPIASTDGLKSRDPTRKKSSAYHDQSVPRANKAQDAQLGLTDEVKIEEETSLTKVRQATLKRKQPERRTQGPRWRSATPPISSVGTVKKFRWPPQYIAPPSTSQSKKRKASDCETYKRRNIGGMRPDTELPRSSSPEFLTENPVTAPQGRRRSARTNDVANYPLPSPPKTPKKTTRTANKTPNVAKPTINNHQPSNLEHPAAKDVVLHFFLSNESLGAVPVTLDECQTSTNFFSQALSAWSLLGDEHHEGNMVAVSATIDGFHWPIVLPWGNATAFERMMETIAIAKIGKIGNLEVKVKCIQTRYG